MKFSSSQFTRFFSNRRAQTNIRGLLKFIAVIVVLFIVYGVLFHLIMAYEGQDDFSWLTGFYWALVTMSTLGYGDIVFITDLGRLFSMVVLFSGMLFLLILLPFTFIEFFYAPWMEALNQSRAPKELPEGTKGHVIITHLNAVTDALIRKLNAYNIQYVVLEPDLQQAVEYSDLGYNVVNGAPDDLETYGNLRVRNAAMVVASGSDTINTNITFTVREYSSKIPVVAKAASPDSVDILQLAGATHIIQLGEMLGKSLARRTLGGNARVHVIGHIDTLVIGEATVQETPLIGKTLKESGLRQKIGVNVVGVWERGEFKQPRADTMINETTVLVLAGTVDQLRKYDEVLSIYHVSDKPVVIIGAGRVGRAVAKSLSDRQIDYRIIDKNPERIRDPEKYILGDAADRSVLEKAGILDAHSALITTHDDDINIYLTIYCRELRPKMQLISRATFEKNINTLHRAGADFVMSYASMGANIIFNILEGQDVLMLAEGVNFFHRKVSKKLAGKTLIESNIRQETGCSVIAIQEQDEMIVNPEPEYKLKQDQDMILIGRFEGESKFNQVFMDNA
jgi:voltage-gated potassium channel